MNNVKQAITAAYQNGQRIKITGYKNSSGGVDDLEVSFLGDGGYYKLLNEAVAWIEKTELKLPGISENDAATAKMEQRASWLKSITLRAEGAIPTSGAPGLAWEPHTTRAEAITIKHLTRHSAKEPVDIAGCRTPVTAAKKLLQAASPMGTYIGMLILEPGKFDRIELVAAPDAVTFGNYRALAMRTEADPALVSANLAKDMSRRLRLIHAALGVTSEAVELLEATDLTNAREEVCDLFWFVAEGLTAIGHDFAPLDIYQGAADTYHPHHNDPHVDIVIAAGRFADHVKAVVYGNRLLFKNELGSPVIPADDQLAKDLFWLVVSLFAICRILSVGPEKLLAMNIAKLKVRYPERYSEQKFSDRDYAAERNVLASS